VEQRVAPDARRTARREQHVAPDARRVARREQHVALSQLKRAEE